MKKIVIISFCIILILIMIISFSIIKFKFNNTSENQDIRISYYNNPKIPEGFEKVDTYEASWELDNEGNPKGWNSGLVIEDKLGNQFVWVPIQNKEFGKYQKIVENLLDKEDEREVIQIDKYGGFWIARFEAGIPYELQNNLPELITGDTNSIESIPVSQKNVIPWNYISLKRAKISATNMYNTEELKSDLISTRQWIRLIKWLDETGAANMENIKGYGNFANSYFVFDGYYSIYSYDKGISYQYGKSIKKDDCMIVATGVNELAKTNNIYDLFGNLMEFTDGYVQDRGYYSVGGYYTQAADKILMPNLMGTTALDKLGFRVILYQ